MITIFTDGKKDFEIDPSLGYIATEGDYYVLITEDQYGRSKKLVTWADFQNFYMHGNDGIVCYDTVEEAVENAEPEEKEERIKVYHENPELIAELCNGYVDFGE